jgi:hypothetical protein
VVVAAPAVAESCLANARLSGLSFSGTDSWLNAMMAIHDKL